MARAEWRPEGRQGVNSSAVESTSPPGDSARFLTASGELYPGRRRDSASLPPGGDACAVVLSSAKQTNLTEYLQLSLQA